MTEDYYLYTVGLDNLNVLNTSPDRYLQETHIV